MGNCGLNSSISDPNIDEFLDDFYFNKSEFLNHRNELILIDKYTE